MNMKDGDLPHAFGFMLVLSTCWPICSVWFYRNLLCAAIWFCAISIIYLLSGFGRNILSSLCIRNRISAGASGALFGLFGTILSELITNWTIYSKKAASILTLLLIISINLAVGMLPRVNNFAHIGGFLTGFLLGFVLLLRPQFGWVERHNLPEGSVAKSKHKTYQYVLCVIALLLLISGLAVSLVISFQGVNGNGHCKWCHHKLCAHFKMELWELKNKEERDFCL